MPTTERRDPPWPLRIPDMERRKKEAVAVAKWKGEPSAHALLVGYVIKGLQRDLRAMAKTTVVSPNFKKGGKK